MTLGWHYRCGYGVPRDKGRAIQLWLKAAEHDAEAAREFDDILAHYREATEDPESSQED